MLVLFFKNKEKSKNENIQESGRSINLTIGEEEQLRNYEEN